MRCHGLFFVSGVALSLNACGARSSEGALSEARGPGGGAAAPVDGEDPAGGEGDAPSEDGDAAGDDELQDPWNPTSTAEIMEMSAMTMPFDWWTVTQDSLLSLSEALADNGVDCPVIQRGRGVTTVEGDCAVKPAAAVVNGSLQVEGEPLGMHSVLVADNYRVSWNDGRFVGLDGRAEQRLQDTLRQTMNLSYSAVGGADEDLSLEMVAQLILRRDQSGEGSGYLWVSDREDGPTGDFTFAWRLDPSRDCEQEKFLSLVMKGAVEVVLSSGGEDPCDGEMSVTVDGVPWDGVPWD